MLKRRNNKRTLHHGILIASIACKVAQPSNPLTIHFYPFNGSITMLKLSSSFFILPPFRRLIIGPPPPTTLRPYNYDTPSHPSIIISLSLSLLASLLSLIITSLGSDSPPGSAHVCVTSFPGLHLHPPAPIWLGCAGGPAGKMELASPLVAWHNAILPGCARGGESE